MVFNKAQNCVESINAPKKCLFLVKIWAKKKKERKKRPIIEAPKVSVFEAFEPKLKANCVESS